MTSRIGLALFGFGRMGFEHAKNILMTSRASLNWVICENIEDARKFQGEFRPNIKCGTPEQYDQALQDSSITGVLIASPTQTHESLIRKSLEAGKAVMCEKPLTSTLDSTKQCYELAEKSKKPLLCALQRFVEAPRRQIENYILYLASIGGIFVDSTVHDLDMCSWLAGSKPKTVYAQGSTFHPEVKAMGDNEQVLVIVTYENGAVSVTDNGRHCPFGYDQRMEVLCDTTMLTVENQTIDQMTSHGDAISTVPRIQFNFMNRYKDAYRNELEHFLDVMEGKAELRITKEDTLRTIRLITLCYESVKLGHAVEYKE